MVFDAHDEWHERLQPLQQLYVWLGSQDGTVWTTLAGERTGGAEGKEKGKDRKETGSIEANKNVCARWQHHVLVDGL